MIPMLPALLALLLAAGTVRAAASAATPPPFASADANSDGKVTSREFATAMKGTLSAGAAKTRFKELDKNQDGALASDEYAAAAPRKGARQKRTPEAK
jgi:ABC-type amino acid transport substrate-binding protein